MRFQARVGDAAREAIEFHLVAGTLVESVPDTRLDLRLNWIVARLPVASLD